jgi:hypothetical protein
MPDSPSCDSPFQATQEDPGISVCPRRRHVGAVCRGAWSVLCRCLPNTHSLTLTLTHTHSHILSSTRTRAHAHKHTQTHKHTHTSTRTQAHTHTHTHTHKHTHTHASTHTHFRIVDHVKFAEEAGVFSRQASVQRESAHTRIQILETRFDGLSVPKTAKMFDQADLSKS